MIEFLSTEDFKSQVFDFEAHDDWVFDKDQPVIVNFFATWCGPCQMFASTLEQLATEYAGRVRVFKVDIDANPQVPELFGVRSVPTTLFVRAGEEPSLTMGPLSLSMLRRSIKDLLGVG